MVSVSRQYRYHCVDNSCQIRSLSVLGPGLLKGHCRAAPLIKGTLFAVNRGVTILWQPAYFCLPGVGLGGQQLNVHKIH